MKSIVIAAISVLTLASQRAEAGVQLRLRVEPASQLPAIEPTLRVEAVNTGATPVAIPSSVVLQVTPPGDASPFVAYVGMRGDERVARFDTGGASPIILEPGETRDLSFWAGPESPTWFAGDSRLLVPGTYRFQLVAHPNLDSDSGEGRSCDRPAGSC